MADETQPSEPVFRPGVFPTSVAQARQATLSFDSHLDVLSVNDVFQRVFGDSKTVVGGRVEHLFAQPYQSVIRAHIEEYMENPGASNALERLGKPHVVEARIPAERTTVPVRVTITAPVKAGGGATSPVFVMTMEMIGDWAARLVVDSTGTIVDAQNCMPLLGESDVTLLGRSITSIAAEPFAFAPLNPVIQFLESGRTEPQTVPMPILRVDGAVFPGLLQLTASVHRSLTEADTPGAATYCWVRLLDDRGSEAVCNVSAAGVMLDCTATFAALFGYEPSELCGRRFAELFPTFVEGPDAAEPGVLVGLTKSGGLLRVAVSLHPVLPSERGAPLPPPRDRSRTARRRHRMRLPLAASAEGEVFAVVASRIDPDEAERQREASAPLNQKGLIVGNYELDQLIAEGGFAQVRSAFELPSRRRVACKIFDKTHYPRSQWDNVHREIEMLRHATQAAQEWASEQPDPSAAVPPVVRLHDVVETSHHLYIFEDLGDRSLEREVLWRDTLPEDEARCIMKKLLLALQWLHRNGIAHLDVEPGTILFSARPGQTVSDRVVDMDLRLCDFGSARFVREDTRAVFCGSIQFVAPEMLLGKAYYGPECDVWSAGVTLYVMLTGNLWIDLYEAVTKDTYVDPPISPEGQAFLRAILRPNGVDRPPVEALLQHAWFTVPETVAAPAPS